MNREDCQAWLQPPSLVAIRDGNTGIGEIHALVPHRGQVASLFAPMPGVVIDGDKSASFARAITSSSKESSAALSANG